MRAPTAFTPVRRRLSSMSCVLAVTSAIVFFDATSTANAGPPEPADAQPQAEGSQSRDIGNQSNSPPLQSPSNQLVVRRCPFDAPKLPSQTEVALNATLLIRTSRGVGSAVLVSPDGFALTAAHVVEGESEVAAVSHGGANLSALVVAREASSDIALLKVAISGDAPCLRPSSHRPALGTDIFILGSPAGEELSFSIAKGIVSGHRKFHEVSFVQLDANVNPGNSGGPVLNSDGGIVGIASWKLSDISLEGLAFAVPGETAFDVLGIRYGETSSENWEVGASENISNPSSPGSPSSESDSKPPAPTPPLSEEGESSMAGHGVDPERAKRERIRSSLILTGATGLSVGVVGVASTGIYYYTAEEMTTKTWNAIRVSNAVSWGLAGAGGALLLGGLLVRKKPRTNKHKASSTSLRLGLSPRGFVLAGRI